MSDKTTEQAQAVARATIQASPALNESPQRAVIQESFSRDLAQLSREGKIDLNQLVPRHQQKQEQTQTRKR